MNKSWVAAIRRGALLIALIPAGGGCTPHDGDLSGEVFIVTKAGQSLKLGLVTVTVVPAEAMLPYVDGKRREAELEIAKLTPDIEKQTEAYHISEADLTRVANQFRAEFQRYDFHSKGAYENAKAKRSLAKSKLGALHEQEALARSGHRYFTALPSGIGSAKTDADGRFTLRIPREGKFALAARATREAPTSETYYWLVAVSLDGQDTKHMMLSNDNLMGAGSADSLLK